MFFFQRISLVQSRIDADGWLNVCLALTTYDTICDGITFGPYQKVDLPKTMDTIVSKCYVSRECTVENYFCHARVEKLILFGPQLNGYINKVTFDEENILHIHSLSHSNR